MKPLEAAGITGHRPGRSTVAEAAPPAKRKRSSGVFAIAPFLLVCLSVHAATSGNVENTKHNLSVAGFGQAKSISQADNRRAKEARSQVSWATYLLFCAGALPETGISGAAPDWSGRDRRGHAGRAVGTGHVLPFRPQLPDLGMGFLPDPPHGWNDSHRAMNNLDTAREYYSKALNIEFDSYAVLGLALINKEKGNYLEAIESLSGLLVNDAKNPRLYLEIAQSWLALDKKDKALDVLTRAQRMGIKNLGIGELLEKLQRG